MQQRTHKNRGRIPIIDYKLIRRNFGCLLAAPLNSNWPLSILSRPARLSDKITKRVVFVSVQSRMSPASILLFASQERAWFALATNQPWIFTWDAVPGKHRSKTFKCWKQDISHLIFSCEMIYTQAISGKQKFYERFVYHQEGCCGLKQKSLTPH